MSVASVDLELVDDEDDIDDTAPSAAAAAAIEASDDSYRDESYRDEGAQKRKRPKIAKKPSETVCSYCEKPIAGTMFTHCTSVQGRHTLCGLGYCNDIIQSYWERFDHQQTASPEQCQDILSKAGKFLEEIARILRVAVEPTQEIKELRYRLIQMHVTTMKLKTFGPGEKVPTPLLVGSQEHRARAYHLCAGLSKALEYRKAVTQKLVAEIKSVCRADAFKLQACIMAAPLGMLYRIPVFPHERWLPIVMESISVDASVTVELNKMVIEILKIKPEELEAESRKLAESLSSQPFSK
jgi:hypothetical protein